jgi:AcrR family transcriptional regulator
MAKSIAEPSNVRSRRTRAALLDAARQLLEEEGFEALTMAAVGDRAAVTRRAVYLHFDTRTDLVMALYGYVGEQEGLAQSLETVWNAPDSLAALDQWARHIAYYTPKVLRVDREVARIERSDPDAAQHRKVAISNQRANVRRLVQWLADEGNLAAGWSVDLAADMVWALASPEIVERLYSIRRWSLKRMHEKLSATLRVITVSP